MPVLVFGASACAADTLTQNDDTVPESCSACLTCMQRQDQERSRAMLREDKAAKARAKLQKHPQVCPANQKSRNLDPQN